MVPLPVVPGSGPLDDEPVAPSEVPSVALVPESEPPLLFVLVLVLVLAPVDDAPVPPLASLPPSPLLSPHASSEARPSAHRPTERIATPTLPRAEKSN
jgi:hypothetical protein